MLENFQEEAITRILEKKKCIFANPTGTGKTHVVLNQVIEKIGQPTNIFCPLIIKKDWEGLIKRFSFPINVYHFEQLLKVRPENRPVFILDEAHFLKNYVSKRSRIMIECAKKAEYIILVSATPSITNPTDWYWLLKLTHPSFDKSSTLISYKVTFCKQEYLPSINKHIFTNKIRSDAMGKQLEELISQVTVKTVDSNYTNIVRKRIKVPSVDCYDSESKINYLMSYHPEIFEHSIIFARMHRTITHLVEALRCSYIDHTVRDKNYVINSWLNNPTSKPIVISYLTGGVGLNLDKPKVDKVVLFEKPFSPKSELQAVSRLTRWKSKPQITIYDAADSLKCYHQKKKHYFDKIRG